MTEYIGARISLISKSNIRYVGILHEINSETSTVALEQVVSHGTEGRRGGDPSQEIAGSDNVYEYIVFRGSDVKDLRIEEQPQPKAQPPPPQLDDPAILGQSSRPYPPQPNQFHPPPPPQYFYPPPPQQRFGPMYQNPGMYGGFPPGPGQPPMGAPHPGMQPPPMMPPQQQPQQPQGPPPQPTTQGQPQPPPQQQQQQQQQQQPPQPAQAQAPPQAPTGPQNRAPPQAPVGPAATRQAAQGPRGPQQPPAPRTEDGKPQSAQGTAPAQNAGADLQAGGEAASEPQQSTPTQPAARVPTGPKARGGIVPALPLTTPGRSPAKPAAVAPSTTGQAQTAQTTNDAIQDLSNKVNRLAVNSQPSATGPSAPAPTTTSTTAEAAKPETPAASTNPNAAPRPRQPGPNNFGTRGNRNNYRGSNQGSQQTRKVEVPTTDYDFESANAKFNKQDLVKEVIASGEDEKMASTEGATVSADATNGEGQSAPSSEKVVIPPPAGGFYNRGSSFFDNISCENKERAEGKDQGRPRGAAFRNEEQKKNLETFGQGSVDGYGYRGGFRGRGRGRGYARGGRGNGYGFGRGGFRQPSQQPQQPAAGN